jgi:RNA polymerase sigma factor (sigma-70 family)
VSALDDDLREVVLLRYEGGLDYRAIADHLDVPLSTVQGRLKRGREALRRVLLLDGRTA